MPKPANRLLAALELLQTRSSIGGQQIAARLGIDRRTVRRYIAALEEMGIPIVAERGRHGGYSLVRGFKLPPMMFSSDEALALSIGLRAAQQIGLSELAPAANSAQAKLERVLPETTRRQVEAVHSAVALDLHRSEAAENPRALLQLATAAREQHRVHLHYLTPQGAQTRRDFDPYAIAFRAGHWYAVGHCHLRRDTRSFRLDRVLAVAALAHTFERRRNFDVLEYLTRSVASLPRTHQAVVRLHTDLASAQRGALGAITTLELDGKQVRLRAEVDDLGWFARALAGQPYRFEIVSPPALRRAVRALGRRLLAPPQRTKTAANVRMD